MAMLKCKMCGGDIIAEAGATYGTCDSCGTTMTLPRLDNEQQANRFNRANHFRRQNEFDKAIDAYEKILADDNSNAEAHWGVVLSRYGIEYVEDPVSHERIPTCNRVQPESILADPDYQAAVNFATDGYTRSLYEEEAKKIAEIQRGILAISRQEEPYDVFICYKETAPSGTRTRDSALAQDIYYQLHAEGYKVFFSRITLEDKLGHEYEPYIFAALNSAKVMVVVGTSAENYNAPWVKNEWSRYLALMRKDRSKLLIPCYRDMDPYDLPEELSMLQSQDMSKIGFIQDLIRGIKKVVFAEKESPVKAEPVIAAGGSSYVPLLKRADIYREDGDFASADEYYEKVLDLNPECAEAYWGKLMAELAVKTDRDYLARAKESFDQIAEEQPREVLEFKFEMPADLAQKMEELKSNQYFETYDFSKIQSYVKQITNYEALYNGARNYVQENEVWWKFWEHPIYQKVSRFGSREQMAAYENLREEILKYIEEKRAGAAEKSEEERTEAERAYPDFAKTELEEIEERLKIREAKAKERAAKVEAQKEKAAELKRKGKTILPFAIAAALLIVGAFAVNAVLVNIETHNKYQDAIDLMNAGKYEAAIQAFEELKGYKEAETYILEAKELMTEEEYNLGKKYLKEQNYMEARRIFAALGDYIDSKDIVKSAEKEIYSLAENYWKEGEYLQAAEVFRTAGLAEGLSRMGISISVGDWHTIGLKADGTVIATGNNKYGQCDVESWEDIVAVSAGFYHTIGLKADGTVIATGYNEDGECDVDDWKDIAAVSAGGYHTIGLKADGTVIATGYNEDGRCDVDDWKDIAAVSAGGYHTIGLEADGTVIATGYNENGQCDVDDWKDIVAVSAGFHHTIGLKADGTVVATGYNENGQCDVDDWKDIVAVSAGDSHTIGLKTDGTVVATGRNTDGKCDIEGWKDIVTISAGDSHTIGLKTDGTVVAVGDNEYGKCDIESWTNIKFSDLLFKKGK